MDAQRPFKSYLARQAAAGRAASRNLCFLRASSDRKSKKIFTLIEIGLCVIHSLPCPKGNALAEGV
jgi:hypothetical protein